MVDDVGLHRRMEEKFLLSLGSEESPCLTLPVAAGFSGKGVAASDASSCGSTAADVWASQSTRPLTAVFREKRGKARSDVANSESTMAEDLSPRTEPLPVEASLAADSDPEGANVTHQTVANAATPSYQKSEEPAHTAERPVATLLIPDCELGGEEHGEEPLDRVLETVVVAWVEAATGQSAAGQPAAEWLRSGEVLCALANAVSPGSVPRVSSSRQAFKQMENINGFLKAARQLGVAEAAIFDTLNLYEARHMPSVLHCVAAFGVVVPVACPEYTGPQFSETTAGVAVHHRRMEERFLQSFGGAACRQLPLVPHGSAAACRSSLQKAPTPQCSGAVPELPPQDEASVEGSGGAKSPAAHALEPEHEAAGLDATQSSAPADEEVLEAAIAGDAVCHALNLVVTTPEPEEQERETDQGLAHSAASCSDSPVSERKVAGSPVSGGGSRVPTSCGSSPSRAPWWSQPSGGSLPEQVTMRLEEDIHAKLAKNDNGLEVEVAEWIEAVTGIQRTEGQSLAAWLRTGTVLCTLANTVRPGLVPKVSRSSFAFKEMENVNHFLHAARELGVPKSSLFCTLDLYEEQNMPAVLSCLCLFGGAVQVNCPEYAGPRLGVALKVCFLRAA